MATKKKVAKKKVTKKKVAKKKEMTQYIARFYSHESLETVSNKINKVYKLGIETKKGPKAFVDIMPEYGLSGNMESLRSWMNSRSNRTGQLSFCYENKSDLDIETVESYGDDQLAALFIDVKLQQKGEEKPASIHFYGNGMSIFITDFEVERLD